MEEGFLLMFCTFATIGGGGGGGSCCGILRFPEDSGVRNRATTAGTETRG